MEVEIVGHITIVFSTDLPSMENTEVNRNIARLAIAKATGMSAKLCKAFVVDEIKVVAGQRLNGGKGETNTN